MGLKDALYILENRGLRVKFSGYGKVAAQSIMPGTAVAGQVIALKLD
ncbi:MAG: PASTA domain-containing protein [Saprospiraceae bacterium]|nr:PASTA domain-containing protein [Saprospiraceae bacterium]